MEEHSKRLQEACPEVDEATLKDHRERTWKNLFHNGRETPKGRSHELIACAVHGVAVVVVPSFLALHPYLSVCNHSCICVYTYCRPPPDRRRFYQEHVGICQSTRLYQRGESLILSHCTCMHGSGLSVLTVLLTCMYLG